MGGGNWAVGNGVPVEAGFSRPSIGPTIAAPTAMPDYPKHLPGFSYIGRYRYSLTFCTFDRRQLFLDAGTATMTWGHILRAGKNNDIETVAYCFMPDHLHLIAEGVSETADLKRFIAGAKQVSGFEYAQANRGSRLWQRYGFEHVLRDDESTQRAVRYILENPVRAGLVEHPRDYPQIGSSVFTIEELLEYAYNVRDG